MLNIEDKKVGNNVQGLLIKSHPKSLIKVANNTGHILDKQELNKEPVIILQIMVFNATQCIVEVVYKKDYDKE